jgi:OHCU decarboxylase
MPYSLHELNTCDSVTFIEVCGPVYEHAPWVAEQVAGQRPFDSRGAIHAAMQAAVAAATPELQLSLIRGHPDLVGRATEAGALTADSAAEQAAAGLFRLTDAQREAFRRYNAAYRQKFDFPFVICARENRTEAILAAFPIRLEHSAEKELATALREIGRIAWLRLLDRVNEP